MKKLSLLLAGLFLGTAVFCQEPGRNRTSFSSASVQAELKKKDPAAWAEIEKLAKTDLFAAMEKFRAAAEKNQLSLPGRRNGRRRGPGREGEDFRRDRRPEGFPPPGSPAGQTVRRDRGPVLEILKKRDPAGFAAYEKALNSAKAKQFAGLEAAIAAEKTLSALAAKHKSELPETRESCRIKTEYLKAKYSSEFSAPATGDFRQRMERMKAEQEKLTKLAEKEGFTIDFSAMMPAFGGTRRGRPENMGPGGRENSPERGTRPNSMETMRQLRKKYPEEMKRFDALRSDGKREEARKLLRNLMERERNSGK